MSDKLEESWQQALSLLAPTPSELERGLALHRELAVCENYGFLPKVFTPGLEEEFAGFQKRGLGWPEQKRKFRVRRVTSATRDADGAREFFAVLERTGISGLIQSVNFMGESLDDAVMILAAYRHLCNTFKDRLLQATCAADIDRAKAAGQVSVFFSLTGLPVAGAGSMGDLDGILDWVDVWYHMGVRFMHLGYNRRNMFADGCLEVRDGGLSDFGREFILRMNRTGIVVDVPHSSRQSVLDAAAVSEKPILASHIGCAEVNDHPRCKTDEELKAIAATGGYVGIMNVPGFLGPQPSITLWLEHVRHAIKTIGTAHVAVGTDVGYGQDWPAQFPPNPPRSLINPMGKNPRPARPKGAADPVGIGSLAWTNWPLMTVALVKLGLKDDGIAQLLGGNLRRVLQTCQPEEEKAALQGMVI